MTFFLPPQIAVGNDVGICTYLASFQGFIIVFVFYMYLSFFQILFGVHIDNNREMCAIDTPINFSNLH